MGDLFGGMFIYRILSPRLLCCLVNARSLMLWPPWYGLNGDGGWFVKGSWGEIILIYTHTYIWKPISAFAVSTETIHQRAATVTTTFDNPLLEVVHTGANRRQTLHILLLKIYIYWIKYAPTLGSVGVQVWIQTVSFNTNTVHIAFVFHLPRTLFQSHWKTPTNV